MNEKLKIELMRRGITQTVFSIRVKISESILSRIIRGYRMPTEEQKKVIAAELGLDISDLFA